jgi:hypothetical protein
VLVFALIRDTDADLAVTVHVLGAMVLVGGLVTAAAASVAGWRGDSLALRRFAVKTLLIVALPAWFVMRIGAQWAYSAGGWEDAAEATGEDPTWIGIGFMTAEGGGLLLLISLILGWIGLRKARQGGGGGLLQAAGVISAVLVLIYVLAVWAMGGKPT